MGSVWLVGNHGNPLAIMLVLDRFFSKFQFKMFFQPGGWCNSTWYLLLDKYIWKQMGEQRCDSWEKKTTPSSCEIKRKECHLEIQLHLVYAENRPCAPSAAHLNAIMWSTSCFDNGVCDHSIFWIIAFPNNKRPSQKAWLSGGYLRSRFTFDGKIIHGTSASEGRVVPLWQP